MKLSADVTRHQLFRQFSADQQQLHGVSVVIPTINRAEVLLDTLGDILVQDFPDWELLVIDQSDEVNERALELLQRVPVRTRYFMARFRGLPQARNFGWRLAEKDIVLYIDDDIRCEPNFVRAHFDAHVCTGAQLVAGGISETNDGDGAGGAGTFNWWTATPKGSFHEKSAGWCIHGKGANFSVDRVALRSVEGFDESFAVGAALYEETDLALRLRSAGHRAWFEPSAHLVHLAAPMGGCRVANDVARYMFGFAHNRAILIFRHLKWWHRPTALARLLLYGLSYSRADHSFRPALQAFKGISAGRRTARSGPVTGHLDAREISTLA